MLALKSIKTLKSVNDLNQCYMLRIMAITITSQREIHERWNSLERLTQFNHDIIEQIKESGANIVRSIELVLNTLNNKTMEITE